MNGRSDRLKAPRSSSCASAMAIGGVSNTIASPVSFAPHAKPAHAPAIAPNDDDDDDHENDDDEEDDDEDDEDDARRVASRLPAASVASVASVTLVAFVARRSS